MSRNAEKINVLSACFCSFISVHSAISSNVHYPSTNSNSNNNNNAALCMLSHKVHKSAVPELELELKLQQIAFHRHFSTFE